MKNHDFLKGHSLMVISTIFFSLNFIVLKYLMPRWMTGFDATFFRIVGGMLLFWFSSIFIKRVAIDKSDRKMVFLGGLFGLFPFVFFFNMALQYSSIIDVSIIMTTPPVLVVLISMVIDKAKVSLMNALGLFLCIAGAIFLIMVSSSHKGPGRDLLGNIFAVISSFGYAFYIISIRKISNKYSSINLLRWVFLAASIGAIPLGIIFLGRAPLMHHPETTAVLLLLYVIIFPSFISFLLMPPAIKLIGQQLVSMYQDLIPVLATILAVILKMDKLYWDQPVAIVVILIGVYISSTAVKKAKDANKLSQKPS